MSCKNKWIAMLLPERIQEMEPKEIISRIHEIKISLGEKLVILAHHYQVDDIVNLADFRGDSLELARRAASHDADYIVFCGVEFMVEMAAILARSGQKVISPAPDAGCPLAEMGNIEQLEKAWQDLAQIMNTEKIIPITYVNSTSEIKAFCGRHNGIVCTSSNAPDIIKWALERGDAFFFLPDENLGKNTCRSLDINKEEIIVWDPDLPMGGQEKDDFESCRAIIWKGYCHVHTDFTEQQVKMARENYPGCKVVVHPECSPEVVEAADASGSTSFIIQYVGEALPGSTIIIGTECNLVNRLSQQHPDKTVLELSKSSCPDMSKVNLRNLYWVLKNIGEVNVVTIDENIAKDARVALERMLSVRK